MTCWNPQGSGHRTCQARGESIGWTIKAAPVPWAQVEVIIAGRHKIAVSPSYNTHISNVSISTRQLLKILQRNLPPPLK